MGKAVKIILITIAVIVVVIGAAIGAEIYSYSKLEPTFNSSGVNPDFDFSLGSGLKVVWNLFQGNPLQAVSSVIKGININGTVEFHNNSFIPLYLPAMNHQVTIEGKSAQQVIKTDSTWIPPYGKQSKPFNLSINKSDIPDMALEALASGGEIEIRVDSQISLGAFTISKETDKQVNVLQTLASSLAASSNSSSVPNSTQANNQIAFSVASFSFTPNSTTIGDTVTASITLFGGDAGTYSLRLLKDIALLPDQLVTTYSIGHDGNRTSQSFSFSLPQGSYHMDLQYNGATLWSQPNDSTRLKVVQSLPSYSNSSSVPNSAQANNVVALSVASYSFTPNSTTIGDTVTASITLFGGDAGTYSLRLLKDIALLPDQLVTTYSIGHDGNRTSQSFSFSLPQGSYHMDLQYNGATLWSQPNDSTRLKVLTTAPPSMTTILPPIATTSPTMYTYSFSTSIDPPGAGSVSLSPSPTGGRYASGTVVTMTATPANGYTFAYWSDALGSSSTISSSAITFTINTNNSIVANFKLIPAVTTPPTTTPAPVINTEFQVSGGPLGYKYLTSYLVQGQQVNISFTISGGNNDIEVYVNNASKATIAGSTTSRYSNNGQISFSAPTSGTYSLYFDNRFSLFTSKWINVTITGGQWN